jgi:hypothetical protein
MQPSYQTVPSREAFGYVHPSELAAALILQGVNMRLGRLNALLTALESNERLHIPGHFLRLSKRPMTADTNVHAAESFGGPSLFLNWL